MTSEGARISLSEFNISLSITGGALPPPKTQDMYISVVHDNKFYPEMTHGQTLLSPVIISGLMQATKKLRKPLIVSLPRCAVTLGQENINSPVSAQLNLNMVLLVMQTLTTLDLVSTYKVFSKLFKLKLFFIS